MLTDEFEMFVESQCDDQSALDANYTDKARNSPGYEHMPMPMSDALVGHRKQCVNNDEKVYEAIFHDCTSYIRLMHLMLQCSRFHGHHMQISDMCDLIAALYYRRSVSSRQFECVDSEMPGQQ